jgi:methylenetetrahydrofolate dehydrogenase (NADP+)/methenyltetrahydrofolate cyclohydrolase
MLNQPKIGVEVMTNIIDGKKVAETVHRRTRTLIKYLNQKGITPKLAVILVGEDKPSQTYVRKKGEAAKKLGIKFELYELPKTITKDELIKKINKIQKDKNLSGLIVQLPLPESLYSPDVLNAIKPELDVDCLTHANLGKLVMKNNIIAPPTPGAVISILKGLKVNLPGKNVTIVGAGALVGKPLSIMLLNEKATVTTCNKETTNLKEKCLSADIVITGVGKKDLIRGNMVKPGAIVIDAGVCFENGKMYGDINFEEVSKKANHVTPTPGGVGPITVARLLWNTAVCAKAKIEEIKPYNI